jgi:nitrogen-specific signal transduction histidine kinase
MDQTSIPDRLDAHRQAEHSDRMAAIGEMVSASAHESRNALQQIQACLALLEVRIGDDSEARELIADLRKAQDQLYRLFEDVRRVASPTVSNAKGALSGS